MIREVERKAVNGIPALVGMLLLPAASTGLYRACASQNVPLMVGSIAGGMILLVLLFGFFCATNQASALTLFGDSKAQ